MGGEGKASWGRVWGRKGGELDVDDSEGGEGSEGDRRRVGRMKGEGRV